MQGLLLTLFGLCSCPLFDLNANLIVVPMSRKEAIYLFNVLLFGGETQPCMSAIKKLKKSKHFIRALNLAQND